MSIESAEVTEPLSPNSPLVSDGVDGVRTTRLLNRAIKQRWPITDEQRQAIIERQIAIASRKNGKAREQSIAAKTVAAFDKLNIEEDKLELQIEESGKIEQHLHVHQQIPHSKIFYDLPPVARDGEVTPVIESSQIVPTEGNSEPPTSS